MEAATGGAVDFDWAVFGERFAAGVCAGSAVVSVAHFQSPWAASLAFGSFVIVLTTRWFRLVHGPLLDDQHHGEPGL